MGSVKSVKKRVIPLCVVTFFYELFPSYWKLVTGTTKPGYWVLFVSRRGGEKKPQTLLNSFVDYGALELHFLLGMLPFRVFICSIS